MRGCCSVGKYTQHWYLIPTKITQHVITNAVKTVGNAGSAAFEESCRHCRVVTSISQNVLSCCFRGFRCMCDRAKTKRCYASALHSHITVLTCTHTSTYHVRNFFLFFHFCHSLPARAYIHTFSKILGPVLSSPSHYSCVFMVVVFVFMVIVVVIQKYRFCILNM